MNDKSAIEVAQERVAQELHGTTIKLDGVKLRSLKLTVSNVTEPDSPETVWMVGFETEVDIQHDDRFLKAAVLVPGNEVGPSGAITMHQLQSVINSMLLQLVYTDKNGKPFQPETIQWSNRRNIMGLFDKLVGRKARQAGAEIRKLEKRDLMEAVVGGCLLIAFADGTCEAEEIKKIDGLLASNKALSNFGPELTDTMNRFKERLEAGYRVARNDIKREIAQIKDTRQDAEDVLINMIEVAFANGDVEPEEEAVLDEIGQLLGLRWKEYA